MKKRRLRRRRAMGEESLEAIGGEILKGLYVCAMACEELREGLGFL